MSFSEQPGYGSPKSIGCIVVGLIGCVIVVFLLVAAAMGHCAPEVNGTGCENEALIKLLMFPGSLVGLIAIGMFAAWRVTKDRD